MYQTFVPRRFQQHPAEGPIVAPNPDDIRDEEYAHEFHDTTNGAATGIGLKDGREIMAPVTDTSDPQATLPTTSRISGGVMGDEP